MFFTHRLLADKFELTPKGLTERDKRAIYKHLIDTIRKHTVYRFGYGVILKDFYKVEEDLPHVRETLLNKPGTRMSHLCFYWNSIWAENNNYNPSISYMFDRGDNFFGEMYSGWRHATKNLADPLDSIIVSTLSEGNKAEHSPLQAADIIAWECRRYFLRKLIGHKINRLASGGRPSPDLRALNNCGKGSFILYNQDDLMGEILDAVDNAITDEARETLIGEGKHFKDIKDYARAVFQFDKDERVAETKARQAEAKKKKAKKL